MSLIDRDMQVGEALWILGHQELSDVNALMRDTFKKAQKLEAIKNLYDRYDETDLAVDDFWEVFREELEKILEGEQTSEDTAEAEGG